MMIVLGFTAALFLYVVFGLILPMNGVLLICAPNAWAKLPRYLRPAIRGSRIPVGIAWSQSQSSKVMRMFCGVLYISGGIFIHFLVISALRTK